ncbi:MAG: helicase, partial [Thermoprotei archaeon]
MLRDPVRILIGDEIGLGKTITAIFLGIYLQDIGRAKRILVLVPRILVAQWVEELSYWVEADNVHQIERENIEVYRSKRFPDGWYVISMDLFVRNRDVRKAVLQVEWDLIIVDEAHKVSPQTAKKRWKYIGEELIAKHTERNVFLLSATPHKGFPDDYIARLQILDPNLEPDIRVLDNKRFYRQTWNTLVFRRMKSDVNNVYERREIFKPAHLRAVLIRPSKFEAEFYREAESFLLELLRKYREASGKRLGAVRLLVTLLAKRAFSSPASAYSTLLFMTAKRAGLLRKISKKDAEKRANALRNFIRNHLAGDYTVEEMALSENERIVLKEIVGTTEPSVDDILNAFAGYASVLLDEDDIKKLRKLMKLTENVRREGDTKITKLEELVKYHLSEGSKIIVFTEYADTAHYIAGRLKETIGDAVKVLTGREAGSRKEREDVEKNFIKGDKYKVLVSTDVLSEGLNLQ